MEHFRPVTDIEEMKSIMGKGMDKNLGIVWQTAHNERMIWTIIGLELRDDKLTVVSSGRLTVNQAFPVYIKINNRNLVFRLALGEYELSEKQLLCKYPKEAKAVEERTEKRTRMPSKMSLHLTLRAVKSSTILDTRIQLLDISEGGLGAAVSRLSQDFFLRSSVFQIVKVGDMPFVEPSALELRHLSDQGRGNKMKLGFSLHRPLSDGFFQLLRQEMKKVSNR